MRNKGKGGHFDRYNLLQTGKMFLYWFDGNQFLTFPAKGMAFKVSCGGCNNRGIKLQS